jgi:hypothetical protein
MGVGNPDHCNGLKTVEALVGFQGGETGNGKLGCGDLVREQKRE